MQTFNVIELQELPDGRAARDRWADLEELNGALVDYGNFFLDDDEDSETGIYEGQERNNEFVLSEIAKNADQGANTDNTHIRFWW